MVQLIDDLIVARNLKQAIDHLHHHAGQLVHLDLLSPPPGLAQLDRTETRHSPYPAARSSPGAGQTAGRYSRGWH